MIQVRALGPLQVTLNGAPAPADLLWHRNIALLLYLARAPAHRCSREHAIGLLWPEKDQTLARQSLREAIRVLRRYLGEEYFRTQSDQLELTAGGVELDTERFDALVASGDLGGATPLVNGAFAEGFALADASPFEDWLLAERWHWRTRAMDALIQHAEQRLDTGDLLGADEPARRALNLDPLSDRALRTLMRRLALAEDRSTALTVYADFVKRIADERAAAPESETTALADRLRRGRAWKLPDVALRGEASVAWRRAPLVHRERELETIVRHWRSARSGQLAVVLIEAAAGVGKTRLAEEVISRVGLDGGLSVTCRAVPDDQHQAMAGILAMCRGGLQDAPGVSAASAAALGAIARLVDAWADRFPAAAATTEHRSLTTSVVEVLRAACGEHPLLLVFDDAQWLDDASLGVLETVMRDLARAPLLVLFTAVPEPTTPKFAQLRARLGRDAPGTVLRPEPLDEPALRVLARWAFPSYANEQLERVSRRIAADSAGVPLLAVEICQAVAQGLDLNATSGAWPRPLRTLDQTMPGDLPETIVAAIRVSFNCLSEAARAALSAAAVLGERVSAEQIGRATGLDIRARDTALDELEWRRWLVADASGYSFVARIVRHVVSRDMITAGQRERMLRLISPM